MDDTAPKSAVWPTIQSHSNRRSFPSLVFPLGLPVDSGDIRNQTILVVGHPNSRLGWSRYSPGFPKLPTRVVRTVHPSKASSFLRSPSLPSLSLSPLQILSFICYETNVFSLASNTRAPKSPLQSQSLFLMIAAIVYEAIFSFSGFIQPSRSSSWRPRTFSDV